jgi:hypothetical protein
MQMTATAGIIGKIAGVLAVWAAILLAFFYRTRTGRMRTLFAIGHGEPPAGKAAHLAPMAANVERHVPNLSCIHEKEKS